MTAGNTSYEGSNLIGQFHPQLSEYCLLNTNEKRILLFDVYWLFRLYTDFENEFVHHASYWQNRFEFEDFLDLCVNEKDTSFINEIIDPLLEGGGLQLEQELNTWRVGEKMYLEFHARVRASLPGVNYGHISIMGFLGTTAVLVLSDESPIPYPTFEESYGIF